MILNAFNSLISSNMVSLEEAKTKSRDSVSKDFKNQILSKVPTQNSVKNQLSSQIVTTENLKETEDQFKALKENCKFLISQVENKENQLKAIQSKTQNINDKFSKLEDIISIANQFLPTLRVIISTAPAILGALSGPLANGLVITRIDDGLKIAKAKIIELEAIIKILSSIQNYINSQIEPIDNNCNEALKILDNTKGQIKTQCNYIDETFLQIITKLPNLPFIDNTTKIDNTKPVVLNPETILDNLENSNKQTYIQYLRDVENNTGYKIVKL